MTSLLSFLMIEIVVHTQLKTFCIYRCRSGSPSCIDVLAKKMLQSVTDSSVVVSLHKLLLFYFHVLFKLCLPQDFNLSVKKNSFEKIHSEKKVSILK